MKDELKVFENRSDDWLAKERKYEESVSAWDFDEGKRLKVEHNKNCDAEYIKETHHNKHVQYDETHNKGVVNDANQFTNIEQVDLSKFARTFIPFILIIVFGIVFLGLAEEGIVDIDGLGYAVPIIIFIVLVNIMPNNKRRKK